VLLPDLPPTRLCMVVSVALVDTTRLLACCSETTGFAVLGRRISFMIFVSEGVNIPCALD
jgi:hypothetical protein